MTAFTDDYFLKDHLDNVRMEKDTAFYPTATLETATRTLESTYYNIDDARVQDVSSVSGASANTSLNAKFYKLNGNVSGQKTGLGIVLKVMAGDKVSFRAESYYNLPGGNAGPSYTVPLTELLMAFAGSPSLAGKGVTSTDVTNIAGNTTSLTNFLNTTTSTNTANAHLCYVLFDEQLKCYRGY